MFKIRASAAGQIMSGDIGLTDKQEQDLQYLLGRPKPTVNQLAKIEAYQKTKANPELNSGAKTYCKKWLKGQIMARSVEFSSKYTEKGNIMEDEAIDFAGELLGLGFIMKNEIPKEDEFMQGECDVLLKDMILDIKNSWSWETFPLLDTELSNMDYYWQGQVYMHLYGRKKFKVIYTLLDTPKNLIEREAYGWCLRNGYEELEQHIYDRFEEKMTYSDLPDSLRIKTFSFDYDKDAIQSLVQRVKMCRDYITELLKQNGYELE